MLVLGPVVPDEHGRHGLLVIAGRGEREKRFGHTWAAIETADVEAAAWVYPEILPMAGEVAFNGVTGQGPVSAYVGRLASILGRHDDAQPYLLDALATAEAFGWEYNRATSLIALAQSQLWGTAKLDARAEQWLSTAEHLCATDGFASWVKRTQAVRARLDS